MCANLIQLDSLFGPIRPFNEPQNQDYDPLFNLLFSLFGFLNEKESLLSAQLQLTKTLKNVVAGFGGIFNLDVRNGGNRRFNRNRVNRILLEQKDLAERIFVLQEKNSEIKAECRSLSKNGGNDLMIGKLKKEHLRSYKIIEQNFFGILVQFKKELRDAQDCSDFSLTKFARILGNLDNHFALNDFMFKKLRESFLKTPLAKNNFGIFREGITGIKKTKMSLKNEEIRRKPEQLQKKSRKEENTGTPKNKRNFGQIKMNLKTDPGENLFKTKFTEKKLIPQSMKVKENSEDKICSKCEFPFSKTPSIYSLFIKQNKNQFPIFNLNFQLKNNFLKNLSEKIQMNVRVLVAKPKREKPMIHLKNLQKVVLKFMLSHEISEEELSQLSPNEDRIFSLFLNKKKRDQKKPTKPSNNARILQRNNSKRVEENLKLVFNNAIGFLKNVFKATFQNSLENHLTREYRNVCDKFEYCFFGFYFEEAALRLDQEIERFFMPKILSKRRSPGIPEKKKLIPKTISKVYLSRIRLSESFLEHFKLFLTKGFLGERTEKIRNKTILLLSKWDGMVQDFGAEKAFKIMEDRITKSERNNLAWTVKDIKIAIEQTLNYLEKE